MTPLTTEQNQQKLKIQKQRRDAARNDFLSKMKCSVCGGYAGNLKSLRIVHKDPNTTRSLWSRSRKVIVEILSESKVYCPLHYTAAHVDHLARSRKKLSMFRDAVEAPEP